MPPRAGVERRASGLVGDPVFVRLWSASTCSGLATWALPFVLGLGVAREGWSVTLLGATLAARSAGFVAAMPLAGIAADRLPRPRVVLWAGLVAAIAGGVLALTVPTGHVVESCVAAVVLGVGQAACRPTFQAMVRDVVPPDRRQGANAAMSISVRTTALLGPTVTAVACQWVGLPWILFGIAVLWLLTALLPDRTAAPAHGVERTSAPLVGGVRGVLRLAWSDGREGFAEARRHRWFVAGLGALLVVIALGYSATSVALPAISRERFGGVGVLAAATTAYTVGALAGGLLMARWRPRARGWWAHVGLAAYGLVPLTLALSTSAPLVMAAYALAGIGIEVFNVPWFTATQDEVPPDRLARVTSLDFLVSYGLAPVGLAALAPAIERWGTTTVLLGCAAACLLAPLLAALVPSSRDLSDRPTEGARVPGQAGAAATLGG